MEGSGRGSPHFKEETMLTVLGILALIALICAIGWAAGKCPGWVSVVLLCIIELLRHIPMGN